MKNKKGLSESFLKRSNISSDIGNGIHIDIRGRDHVHIEGCREILLYNEDMVRILLKKCIMTMIGKGLVCDTFGYGVSEVKGQIISIGFEDMGGDR